MAGLFSLHLLSTKQLLMKKAYLFLLLLMPLLTGAQIINFADPDFKAALLANPSCAQDMMGEPIVLDANGNTLGQLLMVETENAALDVSSLQAGQYFIKVISESGMTTTNFIKK